MPIRVECPSCQAAFRVGDEFAGKRGKCPRCKAAVVVPAAETTTPAQEEGLVPLAPAEIKPPPESKARPRPVAPMEEDSEAYAMAGAPRKVKAVPARVGAGGVLTEGVVRAVEPARPTQTPAQILAAFRHEIEPVRPTPLYRFWIVVVAAVMMLLPLVYLAIVAGVVYAVCLHAVHNVTLFQTVHNVKAAAAGYLGPLIAGVVVVAFMLKPLFARSAKREKARALDPEIEPLLFAFVDGVCSSVGAPRPARIEVNCEINASARLDGGKLAVLGNDLVLTIGLPLVAGLSVNQFAGVLAHEFGHFTQGAGMRLTFLIRSISFWFARLVYQRDSWDETLASWSRGGDGQAMMFVWSIRGAVWLTRRILWVLMSVGNLVSGFMMRQMEYDADRYEARMVGGKVFTSTCWRLRELSLAENGAYVDLRSSWQEHRLPDNLPKLILANVPQIPEDVLAAYRKASGLAKTGLFDTHPCDRDRIASARAEGDEGVFNLDGPATDLFRNFDSLARAATFDRYRSELGPEVRKEQLFPVAELVQTQAVTHEGHQAFDRFFLNAYHPSQRFPLAWDYPKAPADPKAARQALVKARGDLEAARGGNLGAAKFWRGLHEKAIVANTAWTLLKSGQAIRAADFGLPAATIPAAETARDDALAAIQRLDSEFEPYARAGVRRLSLALALLEVEAVVARVPDGAARREEARALYTCVAHLGDRVIPELPLLHRDSQTVSRILNALQQPSNQNNQPMINAVLRAAKQLRDRLEEFQWKAGDTLSYPFDHAREDVTLSGFAIPKLPEKDDLGALLAAADGALERLTTLYRRALGRLALSAEEVERVLGMAPLKLPEPEAIEDVESA